MSFAQLEQHVTDLGGLTAGPGRSIQPFDEARLGEIEALIGAPIDPGLRWWWSRFGGGVRFARPVVYIDPTAQDEVVLGWFLDGDEVVQALDDYAPALHAHRVPILDDGGGNLLVVDPDGSVWDHIHDAALDRNSHRIAASFDSFVRSLRTGA